MGDHVFLKVMPKRGVVKFGKRGKLSSRHIGPFEILERVGTVSYRLALLPILSSVHAVFHVSILRKYTPNPTHVVDWSELAVDVDGTFEEGPMRIMDNQDRVLRGKTVKLERCCGSTEEWKRRHGSAKTLFVSIIPSCSRKKICF